MAVTLKPFLALSLLLFAGAANAEYGSGLDLTLHYGADKYDSVGLRSGLGGVSSSDLLAGTSTTVGATAIFWSGMGELGVIGEAGHLGDHGRTTLLGVLGGFGFGSEGMRLELLGELGGHRYGDVFRDVGVVTRSRNDAWLVSLGVRPGLTFRFGERGHLLLGVWGFARWDVNSQDVQVNLAGNGNSTYRLGGSQFGAALRAGFSL